MVMGVTDTTTCRIIIVIIIHAAIMIVMIDGTDMIGITDIEK